MSSLHVCLLSKSFRLCLTILMCPVSYLMLSGYLSNSGTKSKERLAYAYGGWSWQRNGLTLSPFWLESCKITPAGVWERVSASSLSAVVTVPRGIYLILNSRSVTVPSVTVCYHRQVDGESAAGKCFSWLLSWPVLRDVQSSRSHTRCSASSSLLLENRPFHLFWTSLPLV